MAPNEINHDIVPTDDDILEENTKMKILKSF